MPKKLSLMLLSLVCGGAGYSQAESAVTIRIKDTATFDLLYHRANSTATGAAVGGLLGAGIEEGIRSSKDTEKEKSLLPYINNPGCEDTLAESLKAKLEAKGMNVLLQEGPASKSSASEEAIILDIDGCGFKLINSQAMTLSAYVKLEVAMQPGGSSKEAVKESVYLVGKNTFTFEELLSQKESIDSEFQEVLKKAGTRLANKYIYKIRSK